MAVKETIGKNEVAVDPAVFVLHGKALEIYFMKKFPHVPLTAALADTAGTMSKEEKAVAYQRATAIHEFAGAAAKAFRE